MPTAARTADPLKRYTAKRNFKLTPEPQPALGKPQQQVLSVVVDFETGKVYTPLNAGDLWDDAGLPWVKSIAD